MAVAKKAKDRHAAEAAVLVRMTAVQRDQLQKAVAILNDRFHPDGGKVYLGPFMLQAALRTAKEVIDGHIHHVTGKRSS